MHRYRRKYYGSGHSCKFNYCRFRRSDKRRLNIFRFKLIIIILLLICSVFYCDIQVKPIIIKNAEERADAVISNIVYDSGLSVLGEDEYKNGNFVKTVYDSVGAVKSVQCNTILLNRLMTEINNDIEARIAKDSRGTFSVHSGTLTGITAFLGAGPMITYKYDLSTNVNCSMMSEFKAAGMNQTCHRIVMRIAVKTTVIIPWCSTVRDVISDFPVSETIIVGSVPSSYTTIDLQGGKLYDNSK